MLLLAFILHLPCLRTAGPVYGLFFLVGATLIAPLTPFAYAELSYGVYLIFSLHLLWYALIIILFQNRAPLQGRTL